MQVAIPLFIFLIILSTVPAFGATEDVTNVDEHVTDPESSDEHTSPIRSGVDAIFDSIGSFGKAQTDASDWFDDEKKDQINDVNNQGIKTGKTAFDLWWDFHEFVVKSIFAGSPIPFDVGIAILISFVLSAILVFFLFKDFFKKTWKIGAVIIAVIAIILVLGIENVAI